MGRELELLELLLEASVSRLACLSMGSLSFLASSTEGLQGLMESPGTLTGLLMVVTTPAAWLEDGPIVPLGDGWADMELEKAGEGLE